MRGIDLSHWNGELGASILKDENVELDFCICKHSEGRSMVDNRYKEYSEIAEKRGILHGGYHFYVGNHLTSEYRKRMVDCFASMYSDGAATCYIDWEREIDAANGHFICDTINAVKEATGRTPGIYASYSVFGRNDLLPGNGQSVAQYCKDNGISIWCARYKYKDYRPEIMYGSVMLQALQPSIGPVRVDVNQISRICLCDGEKIDLDYDIAWNYGLG